MMEETTNTNTETNFEFRKLSFTVSSKNEPKGKKIIEDISCTITSGRVLAILGPGGAGKSTLINCLTLGAFGGKTTGELAIDGKPMTRNRFDKYCYVMSQHDNHWAFLTCRETILYAAQLYLPHLSSAEQETEVDRIIKIIGLESCKDVKCGNEFMKGLSGGQLRRLSLALALVKKPKILFLDEPTSGLDAAAAANIMSFLTELARKENLIIITIIHQPSSTVFNEFDQVMVLSKGRTVYCGDSSKAVEYMGSIGHEIPPNTNPADFLLDCVNADFVGDKQVDSILNKWSKEGEAKYGNVSSEMTKADASSSADEEGLKRGTILQQTMVMLRRHGLLSLRDPTLYLGRALMALFGNIYFGIVYYKARFTDWDQVYNRQWLNIWLLGPTVCCTIAAVYVFNLEYKAVAREIKNGMVDVIPYVLSRFIIEIPAIVMIFLFATLIPTHALSNFDISRYHYTILLWPLCVWAFECHAQLLGAQLENPLLGMMSFQNFFFTAFLFGGFLLPEKDMVWPFKLFYYILPFKYGIRGLFYQYTIDEEYETCPPNEINNSICYTPVEGTTGAQVLERFSLLMPAYSSKNTFGEDVGCMLAIGLFFKIMYTITLMGKVRKVSKISPIAEKDTAPPASFATRMSQKISRVAKKEQDDEELNVMDRESPYVGQNSILKFEKLTFTVDVKNKEKKKVEKKIISDIQGSVTSGHVLAILGPSGAGKTTLINCLTLNAFGGKTTGKVELDGRPLSVDEFRKECYLVTQHDNHWPFLTCQETLSFAAQLYLPNLSADEQKKEVQSLLKSMGLQSCADVKVGNEFIKGMSGGQIRRLSISIALMKRPRLLFLDEPTSGLDAAAAAKIMQFLTKVAQKENIMVVATIHQPSSSIYAEFDEVMVLSKGRTAYLGSSGNAMEYMAQLGHEMPANTNPADFLLDLVNSDFSSDEQVESILDSWQKKGALEYNRKASQDVVEVGSGDKSSKVNPDSRSQLTEIRVMFWRHALLAIRDPVLYLGRALLLLSGHIFFGLVYIKARDRHQDQVINRVWIIIWYLCIVSCMGVIAVYATNQEYVAIRRELKNGMCRPGPYLAARFIVELPFMVLISIIALLIPAYCISGFNWATFGPNILVWAICMLCFEVWGQLLGVASDNFLVGMMTYMTQVWFNAFLYGGFLLPEKEIIWPFRLFAYLFPFKYTVRTMTYLEFYDSTFEDCDPTLPQQPPFCYGKTGKEVLNGINQILPLYSSEDRTASDVGIIIAMALGIKLVYCIIFYIKSHKHSKVHSKPSSIKSIAAAQL